MSILCNYWYDAECFNFFAVLSLQPLFSSQIHFFLAACYQIHSSRWLLLPYLPQLSWCSQWLHCPVCWGNKCWHKWLIHWIQRWVSKVIKGLFIQTLGFRSHSNAHLWKNKKLHHCTCDWSPSKCVVMVLKSWTMTDSFTLSISLSTVLSWGVVWRLEGEIPWESPACANNVYTRTNNCRHSGKNDQSSKVAPPNRSQAPKEDKNNNTLPVSTVNPTPMVLMIQTELCEKHTLKTWLLDHIHNRDKKTVLFFFDQVYVRFYLEGHIKTIPGKHTPPPPRCLCFILWH